MSGRKGGDWMLQLPRWRAEDPALDSYDLHIAAWLRGHDDDYLTRNVTASEIERKLHISRPRIRKSLAKLVELGVIGIERGVRDRLLITVHVEVWEQHPTGSHAPHTGSHAPDDMEPRSRSEGLCLSMGETSEIPTRVARATSRAKVRVDVEAARVDKLFDAFYELYPRKVGKPAARRAFAAAVKRNADLHAMAAGLRAWSAYWSERGDPQFVPYPATWLNQERWNDSPPAAAVPLSVLERAWLKRHPGATADDARAHTAEARARRDVVEARVVDGSTTDLSPLG